MRTHTQKNRHTQENAHTHTHTHAHTHTRTHTRHKKPIHRNRAEYTWVRKHANTHTGTQYTYAHVEIDIHRIHSYKIIHEGNTQNHVNSYTVKRASKHSPKYTYRECVNAYIQEHIYTYTQSGKTHTLKNGSTYTQFAYINIRGYINIRARANTQT